MSITSELTLLSIAELSRKLQEKEISPVELLNACFEQIATLDGRLHAFNSLRTKDALVEAQCAEKEILRGNWQGHLHGIPVGIKDLIDVAGLPTTAQALHRQIAIATEDANVVRALKDAGAVIIGKQSTLEYAAGIAQLDGPLPTAHNPWNLKYDPAGSSSGSAVAVAAGLCLGSVGTETAGSIRDPASWCGVAGLKPTDGLVSRRGVLPLSKTMDCIGPLAWTVEDCATMLSGMVSSDPEDVDLKGFRPPDLSILDRGIRGLRVGVVRHFYEDDANMDVEVLEAMELSLSVLEGLGAQLSTVQLAAFDHYGRIARNITWPEEYAEHEAELIGYPDRFGAVTRSRLEEGRNILAHVYIHAMKQRACLIDELTTVLRDVDLLVLPTTKKPAQVIGYEATPLGELELSLTRPFNLTGNPVLALCNGFSTSGLPLSIQVVGRHFADDMVLRTGHALETALDIRSMRPPIVRETT
jgi:aspartyl-tRNA(Asn)/glutamyl-tRNA(Gln) amidotransferase subunit A